MRKLLILTLLVIGFFSCNRKHGKITDLTHQPHVEHPGSDVDERPTTIDTLGVTYEPGTTFRFSEWQSRQDTSDIIVKYVFNWEEGEIETIAGKIVHVTSRYGIWTDAIGKPIESKLFKVKDGVWIPVEWPKDIVNVYIRPKK